MHAKTIKGTPGCDQECLVLSTTACHRTSRFTTSLC